MRPSRTLAVLLAACASGCAAASLPDKPVLKDYELHPKTFPMGSGLRVVVQEDHSAPVVVVTSVYGVGSTADPKGVEGLAHLIEHLAFRTKPAGRQLWDHLKRLGANFNASTSWDVTNYYAIAHKDYLNELLQLEAWRLSRTLEGVTPEVFATEKEVVRNEHRQRSETTVGSRTFDMLAGALFPNGHPVSRPIGGTHESLNAATLDHAKAFVKEYYRPDNCVIVIGGDVDPQQVGKLLGMWPQEVLFGPGGPTGPKVPPRAGIASRPAPEVPPPTTTKLLRDKGPVSQPELWIGWSAPAGHRGNDALLEFAAARLNLALGQGVERRFDEDDDIESLGGGVEPLNDASIVFVRAALRPGANPEKVRQRILDAIVHTWTTDLGKLQTEASRWFTATDLMLQLSDPVTTSLGIAGHLSATGSSSFYSDTLTDLAKVQSSQIADLAYKYLHRDRSVAIYLEPENDEVPKMVGGGPGGAAGGGGARPAHDIGRETAAASGDMSSQRILQIAPSPNLAKLPRWKLANGLELVATKHGNAPVAQVIVGIKGGDSFTSPVGLASYAHGFATRRCFEYGELDAVGGRIFDFTGLTSSTFNVDIISGNLSNGLAVLSDNLSCLEVSEEAFLMHDRMLQLRGKSYARVSKMPDFLATKRLWAELYPNHPYGTVSVDPASLKNIGQDDVAGYIRSHFRPGNAVAVVVGDVDPNEVKTLADKYLTRWTGGAAGSVAVRAAPPPPAARRAFLIDRPKATQATVRIACRLADATPDRLPAYELAGELANERAWSVREEWGATYGVNAGVDTLPGGASHLVVGGAIESKQVGRSVARLLDIVAEVGTTSRLDEKFFLVKRWDLARQFAQRFTSGGAIAGGIIEAAVQGWPDDVWDQYPQRLAGTTKEMVGDLMKPCVGKEIISIVGDASVVRPQLEAAGLKLEAN